MDRTQKGDILQVRIIWFLIVILVYLPTIYLIREFARDFIFNETVIYSHGFLMALCGSISSVVLTCAMSCSSVQGEGTSAIPEFIEIDAYRDLKEQIDRMEKSMVIRTRADIIEAMWTVIIVATLKLFHVPNITFWIGLVLLCIFECIELVKFWNLRTSSQPFIVTGVTLYSRLYNGIFWMIYAYAFGWFGFAIWAMLRIVVSSLFNALISYTAHEILEQLRIK